MSQREPINLDENERDLEQQRLLQQEKQNEELDRMAWLMSEQKGRAIVWQVLLQSGVHHDLHDLQASLARPATEFELGHAEGRRSVGKRWFHLLHATPVLFQFYPLMVQENQFATP